MAIKLKHIIFYLGLWILTTSSAYYFGTMHPNQKLLVDLTNKIASEIQKDYAQHKFFEPEIVYNDNETFMRAVNSCVDFVNLTTPPADRIHKDIIVAMAVIESGYGTSRFAIQGNNLFGIRTWNKNEASSFFGFSFIFKKFFCERNMIFLADLLVEGMQNTLRHPDLLHCILVKGSHRPPFTHQNQINCVYGRAR